MFTFDADMEWDRGAPWYRPTRICHLVSGAELYRTLDAAQLLKHALGLAVNSPSAFALYYLYYDVPCLASKTHCEELLAFGDLPVDALRPALVEFALEDYGIVGNRDDFFDWNRLRMRKWHASQRQG